MNRYNELLNQHFAGCILLHQGVDPHRNRPAKYYAIPGNFQILGYTDERDSFIVPLSEFIPAPVHASLKLLESGRVTDIKPNVVVGQRRKFVAEPPAPQVRRRAVF